MRSKCGRAKEGRVAPRSTRRAKNNWMFIEYSSGTGCARSLEQFYTPLKRTHGISPGAQRSALPAGGTGEITRKSSINSKPEK
jgi:hypothetical protein